MKLTSFSNSFRASTISFSAAPSGILSLIITLNRTCMFIACSIGRSNIVRKILASFPPAPRWVKSRKLLSLRFLVLSPQFRSPWCSDFTRPEHLASQCLYKRAHMLRRMAGLPRGRRSLSSTSKSAKMGSLMVDPPSPQGVPFSVKTALNGNITSHHSQRASHTHAAMHTLVPKSVTSSLNFCSYLTSLS